MLMPYYIASLNIEHEYHERSGRYEPFEGISYVDTLDMGRLGLESLGHLSKENARRIARQWKAPINVVIGNPPYNVGQLNENDNNKNRKYEVVDRRVRETYVAESGAKYNAKTYDAYVKFFRWASDRLEDRNGAVCFVSNNNFLESVSFDGMRKRLLQDFTRLYHLDLHGNVRRDPRLSGTTHNVFGIQVGVGITIALRNSAHTTHEIHYFQVPELDRREDKLAFLAECVHSHEGPVGQIKWTQIQPDSKNTWVKAAFADEFSTYLPIGTQGAKTSNSIGEGTIFSTYSLGMATNRDAVLYGFDKNGLLERVKSFVEDFNEEVDRYKRHGKPDDIDNFVRYEKIKWGRDLKGHLKRLRYLVFDGTSLRRSLYRPFSQRLLYFDRQAINMTYRQPYFFPAIESEQENLQICLTAVGTRKPFHVLICDSLTDLHLTGDSQCFPLYTYDADGTNRRENVTDWALATFRDNYGDPGIEKLDIFHYVYGLLHHPGYRERHADSLRRELPRIPLAPDFAAFRDAGRELARLHLNYEHERPWDLEWEVDEGGRSTTASRKCGP